MFLVAAVFFVRSRWKHEAEAVRLGSARCGDRGTDPTSLQVGGSNSRGGGEDDDIHARLVEKAVSGERVGGCRGRRRMGMYAGRGHAGGRS